ncbi:ATPase synthesis protein 25 like [Verticillium longisporum]|nr:ATPase synthesis protein 25 like [Verticillium longisporum]PNH52665.1 hypothetical protein VD0003_g4667 [Verticillium dahliae]PNH66326.1 hypothetical protein VD0002_g3011 [Verticillium dahliae]
MTALGCFRCRTAALRAVASASRPALRSQAAPSRIIRSSVPATRSFTSARTGGALQSKDTDPELREKPSVTIEEPKAVEDAIDALEAASIAEADTSAGDDKTTEASSETPWYLQVDAPVHAPTQHVPTLPTVPDGAPSILEHIMKFAYEEMGLDDLELLDLREMDPPPALGPNLLMLFGTARGERHLHVSSSRLVKWLRNKYKIDASAAGLIGPGELKTKLRRLRKKAKLMGTSAVVQGGDDGITTGWICVNLGTQGSDVKEAASFDSLGQMSGFGGPATGTTLVVQVMTESRRTELNLEHLWMGQLRRANEAKNTLEVDAEEKAFYAKFGAKPPKPKTRVQPKPAFAQKRGFSTSARQLATPSVAQGLETDVDAILKDARLKIDDIREGGAPVTAENGLKLLGSIFRSVPVDEDISVEQATLALSLLETMTGRGLPILNHDVLVTMIESIVKSGAQGDRIRQIQSNVEYLLTHAVTTCPSEMHLLRLLEAYHRQKNLDRFWQTWRTPPRHGAPRGPLLYRYMFERAAMLKRRDWCIEVLRHCAPEMMHEAPPVLPVGEVWKALRACLLVVDAGAEALAETPPVLRETTASKEEWIVKRKANAEFVKMYRDFDATRQRIEKTGRL